MSSLTKLLHTDRTRQKMSDQGGTKTPMVLNYPIPEDFEEACISRLDGKFHMVRVSSQRMTKTGFFELDPDDEEKQHADLVEFLYDHGQRRNWGGVTTTDLPDDDLIEASRKYFRSYDLQAKHAFVGLIGFAALYTADLLELPEEVDDPDDLDEELLQDWMDEHLHVGKLKGLPVYYNPHMTSHILLSCEPDTVGMVTRVGTHASVLVHNAERSMIIIRVELNDYDDLESDTDGGTETREEVSGD